MSDIKSPNIKTLVEFLGVAAIVVSLLFLGYELKRANDIAETEATSTVYQVANDFNLTAMADQNVRRVLIAAFSDQSESLTRDDRFLLGQATTSYYNLVEVAWKYHQKGLMSDEDMAVRFTELCSYINGSSYIADRWEPHRNAVLAGFYEDVNRECDIADE